MQETWKFNISISNEDNNLEHLIQETLLKYQKDLGIFLSYYYKKEGAVTESVKLIGSINFLEEFKGDFIVNFDLIHFNACLNIHEQKKEKMTIQFGIDRDSNQLILTGPYWPEREMDEI